LFLKPHEQLGTMNRDADGWRGKFHLLEASGAIETQEGSLGIKQIQ
jgi:hypothetical protein